MHLSRQWNCWSLRCSWSIACRRCSNNIFILHWTLGFNILCKDNCKPSRETFRYCDLVRLILETLRYFVITFITKIWLHNLLIRPAIILSLGLAYLISGASYSIIDSILMQFAATVQLALVPTGNGLVLNMWQNPCLYQLAQLERLRSEIPCAAPWLPILVIHIRSQVKTRTTRKPAFWGYPCRLMITNTIESYWIPKISDIWILKQTLHATHLLKLLDKMCKYEMDPTSIVEDTERTRFCPQTDRRTRWNQYTPLSTSLKRGYKKTKSKWQIFKNCQKFKFWNFARNITCDTPSEVAW